MHFCVSAARVKGGFSAPRKYGTNWFMPAFVKRRFGDPGSRLADGTMACPFSRKKSRKDFRISAEENKATWPPRARRRGLLPLPRRGRGRFSGGLSRRPGLGRVARL